jgi:hypothetical protein
VASAHRVVVISIVWITPRQTANRRLAQRLIGELARCTDRAVVGGTSSEMVAGWRRSSTYPVYSHMDRLETRRSEVPRALALRVIADRLEHGERAPALNSLFVAA